MGMHKFMNDATNKPFEVNEDGKRQIQSMKNWTKKYSYIGAVNESSEKKSPVNETDEKTQADFQDMRKNLDEILQAKKELKYQIEKFNEEKENFEKEKSDFEIEKQELEAQKIELNNNTDLFEKAMEAHKESVNLFESEKAAFEASKDGKSEKKK